MAIILSLTAHNGDVWALGPEGLYAVQNATLEALPQPESFPACCLAIDSRLLVGGAPHGVAFSLDDGANWQAGWMDGVEDRVVALAADPRVDATGVLLAGSENSGVLRSADRGHSWVVSNFGLQSFQMLSLAWAPVAPAGAWPRWEVVFAGAEEGIYRSPNGGLGWKRSAGLHGAVLTIAVAPDFHSSGVVLAGAEDTGLWRSTDGGRSFAQVAGAPAAVNALAPLAAGWALSDPTGIWLSTDGLTWTPAPDARPALALLAQNAQLLAGGAEGVETIELALALAV